MTKTERKAEGKPPNLPPRESAKQLGSILDEVERQSSRMNSAVDSKREVAQAVKEPYILRLSPEEAAQLTGCSSGESAKTNVATHWLMNAALKVLAPGATEPDFTKLSVLKTLLLNSGPRTPVEAMLLTQITWR